MKRIMLITLLFLYSPLQVNALDSELCSSECYRTCCGRAGGCSNIPGQGTYNSRNCDFECHEWQISDDPQSACPLVVKQYEVVDLAETSKAPHLNNRGEVAFDAFKYRQPGNLQRVYPETLYGYQEIMAINTNSVTTGFQSSGLAGPSGCNSDVHALKGFEDWTLGATRGFAINSSGVIGGLCVTGSPCIASQKKFYACLDVGARTVKIELENGLEAKSLSYLPLGVFAVNNSGDAVGSSVISVGSDIIRKAFLRKADGALAEISPTETAISDAFDINASRIVVGQAQFGEEALQAFVYNSSSDTLTNLKSKLQNPTSSRANAINDKGVVVGTAVYGSEDNAESKAFRYSVSSKKVTFFESVDGWTFEQAQDINDSSEIVGLGKKDDVTRAFMLRPRKLRESERVNLDFDFDGLGDLSIWRPSIGGWFASQVSWTFLQWGLHQDRPLLGNFDSDINREAVVFRPQTSTWYVNFGSNSLGSSLFGNGLLVPEVQHGLPGDVPLLGDFNGDNLDDFVVWRPFRKTSSAVIEGQWYIKPSAGVGEIEVQWGLRGDLPYLADFDGDGLADIGVWRNATGEWYVLKSSENYANTPGKFLQKQWGLPGDHPMPGDYDGDGLSDLAVWRPSNGTWYICTSRFGFDCSAGTAIQWGLPGDIPVSVAMNGDHTLSLAVYRSTEGNWYVRDLLSNQVITKQWGLLGDIPLKQSIRTTMNQLVLLQ